MLSGTRRFLVAMTFALVLAPIQGGMAAAYKWTDDQGVTEYSQLPPPGKPSERINTGVKSSAPPPAPAPAISTDQTNPPADAGKTPAPQANAPQLSPEQMQENCRLAKQNLSTLETNPRILMKGEDGNMVRLTEEQRQAKIAESKEQIKKFCKE